MNGLCEVSRNTAEWLVVSIYYYFCVSGMIKIIAVAKFYDDSNKLFSINTTRLAQYAHFGT